VEKEWKGGETVRGEFVDEDTELVPDEHAKLLETRGQG
jgi:hypothetical protein